ncbi:SDR family NAD(P)-dependent oxidoreductase [Amycolatopsis sp., V23-08]|uniref:SDR family NAD(P)-dependent oxidoreductase n=1 Tax=Amycolatopsis heterodermiae TaxID=3110235 RepID=A0ABU5RDQ1_9PSEU|nr:SDR family NAD(P)-dependent oxidoreductase [Amycolatopsis sp., V23-08]MEA5364382.1 SDR family NAD(P)-dependent oxidoreductase [Amycolatopsis sp., V23-08]
MLAVLGAGPGLGLSIAHRFGREGFTTALVSRSGTRHAAYRASLAEAGVAAHAFTADVTDEAQVHAVLARITDEAGEIDTVYFGPADLSIGSAITPLPEAGAGNLRVPFESIVLPAAQVTQAVLPRMLERGAGSLLFAGGISGKYPIPLLGSFAPAAAALRMYVLTLNAALRGTSVYAGTLTIGGVIERGDIHRMFTEQAPDSMPGTLDPDAIAERAWALHTERDEAEAEFNTLVA